MAYRLMGTATTDSNGIATLTYTGAGRGKIQVVAIYEDNEYESAPIEILDCIIYDSMGTDTTSNYYCMTSSNNSITYDKGIKLTCGTGNRYVQYGSTSNGITTNLDRFKGKTVRFEAFVDPSNQCRLAVHQLVDNNYQSTYGSFTSSSGDIYLDVDIDPTLTRLLFRVDCSNNSEGDTVTTRRWRIYPI